MNTRDWADGGFSGASLWFETDGDAGFVEAGVSAGWGGLDQVVFYRADKRPNLPYRQHEWTTLSPVVGHDATFKAVRLTSGDMRVSVTDDNTGVKVTHDFDGHSSPFYLWSAGAEYTCPSGPKRSYVDTTHVYLNQYRRASDRSWRLPAWGGLDPSGNPGSGVAWCTQWITFRFWVNDASLSGC
jgi:hypothetical protein